MRETRGPWRHRHRLPAVLIAVAAGLAFAPAALGHSVLIATEPADDAVVEESPTRVLLRYDEPVEASLGSIRVFDTNARRVDAERVSKPRPNEIAVEIDRRLSRGTYTVVWRAISADSDPIRGAFVFHVGAPGAQASGIAAEVLTDTPLLVSILYASGRFLEFALMLLCVGGLAGIWIALRTAAAPLRRRLYRIVAVAAGVLVPFALVGIPLQGAAAGGTGLAEAVRWSVVSSVLDTRYGELAVARSVLAVLVLVVAFALAARAPAGEHVLAVVGLGLGAAILTTFPLSGHPSVLGALAVFVDAAHVAAAAAWTGGLALVVVGLVLAGEERWPLAARAVPRFSAMAVVSVGVVVVAGLVNAYLQVRTLSGLTTTYGLLLLAKAALIAPLLLLGAYNNRYAVPRLRAGIASRVERRRFLQAATGELAIVVAVVAVSAVLVNAPPARTAAAEHAPATAVMDFGDFEAHVSVEPGMAGSNEIHMTFEDGEGKPAELAEVTVSATLAREGVGPLKFEGRRGDEEGQYVVPANLPIAGNWQLRVEARRGEFELLTEIVSMKIREES